MAFKDYSNTPASNTTIGEDVFIGPNMDRNKVRPALQQIAADGRDLYDEMVARGAAGTPPAFIQTGTGAREMTLQEDGRLIHNVAQYLPAGYVTDGSVDYTAQLQAAMTDAAAVSAALQWPGGTFKVTAIGLLVPAGLVMRGAGLGTTVVKNTNGNVLRLNGENYHFSDMSFESVAGGATILQVGAVARSTFRRIGLIQGANGYGVWDNAGFAYIANLFANFYQQHVLTATVESFKLLGTGGTINNNRWLGAFVRYSGNYAFSCRTTNANAHYDNIFKDIVFEVCTGGGIDLSGNWQFIIDTCANWDAAEGAGGGTGVALKDFFNIALGPSGSISIGDIINCGRRAGTLNSGIYDVRLPSGGGGAGVRIINCSGTGSDPFLVEADNNAIFHTGQPGSYTVNNAPAASYQSGGVFNAGTKFQIAGTQVVGPRDAGWTAMTGTGSKGALAAAAAGTASAGYVQAELQTALNRIAALEARLKAYDAALITHGLIGA